MSPHEQLDVFGDLAAPASDKQPQHSREGEIGEGKQHPLVLPEPPTGNAGTSNLGFETPHQLPSVDAEFLPIGQARVMRHGGDATVVAWSRMVEVSLEAAEQLASVGVEVEVIDLRSLVPMDVETVARSVSRTGRGVVVHEAVVSFGAGAEVAARIMETSFDELRAPVVRVGAPAVPMPFSPPLEAVCIPDVDAVKAAVTQALAR